jgi:hypothetical protein
MRTIYIDSDFKCHTAAADGLEPIEADFFNGKCDAYIEGYRFIPAGQTWTREDGVQFAGEMISPVVDYDQLNAAQREDELSALTLLNIGKVEAPYEEAVSTKAAMTFAGTKLTDEEALHHITLYDEWLPDTVYLVNDRRRYLEQLYKCVQAHTSQADWTPDVTPALWVKISTEEWPEWVQPQGGHDAYAKGDKVSHNGNRWTSSIDANVWEPGVYGWEEMAYEH